MDGSHIGNKTVMFSFENGVVCGRGLSVFKSLRKEKQIKGLEWTNLWPAYRVIAVTSGAVPGDSGSIGWERTLGSDVLTWRRAMDGTTSTVTGRSSLCSRFSSFRMQVLSVPNTLTV